MFGLHKREQQLLGRLPDETHWDAEQTECEAGERIGVASCVETAADRRVSGSGS